MKDDKDRYAPREAQECRRPAEGDGRHGEHATDPDAREAEAGRDFDHLWLDLGGEA